MRFRSILFAIGIILVGYFTFKAIDQGWFDDGLFTGISAKKLFRHYFACSLNEVSDLKGKGREWMGWDHILSFSSKNHIPLQDSNGYIICSLDENSHTYSPSKCFCLNAKDMSNYEQLVLSEIEKANSGITAECKNQINHIRPRPFQTAKIEFQRTFPGESESLNDTNNIIFLCNSPNISAANDLKGIWLIVNKRTHKYFYRNWYIH